LGTDSFVKRHLALPQIFLLLASTAAACADHSGEALLALDGGSDVEGPAPGQEIGWPGAGDQLTITLPDSSRGAQFNYAPEGRVLAPLAIAATHGTVVSPDNVLHGEPTELRGNGSYIVLDFAKEVGGLVSLTFSAASDAHQVVGLAFSESSLYAGPNSDRSNGGDAEDGAIYAALGGGATTYTMPRAKLRGGFRYLTVFLAADGSVTLDKVSLDFSPDPLRAIPSRYPNYFYSNDDTLNRAWYAGAYTVQTNIVRVDEGRSWPPEGGWDNSATVGTSGDVILVDGAKRDRIAWPGDLGISLPTEYVALFETAAAKSALHTLFDHQSASGELPFAGPPVNLGGSDTYHLWTLLGVALYHTYANDRAWLDTIWPKYKAGVAYSVAKIDGHGLFAVPDGANDWARDQPGGENIAANALLYAVLAKSAELARAERETTLAATWSSQAEALKVAVNAALWDPTAGAYKDNPGSALHPQDGNALAVWFGLTDSPAKARSISSALAENWNDKGARAPEFTRGTGAPLISTFASSMELMSHFVAGYDVRGLDMIRTMWGYMLTAPHGTASTFWEGYSSSGALVYDGSYTSLSHGWGTGPTAALTFYVLGAAPDTPAGRAYHVIPHPGDLTHVEGDLTFAPGEVLNVSYDVGKSCSWFALRIDARTLKGSQGRIGVPTFGAKHEIALDGILAWNGTELVPGAGVASASADARYVYFSDLGPGLHIFTYQDGTSCAGDEERWTFCGDEGSACTFEGTQRVRFGKDSHYSYGIFTGAVACSTSSFGDPGSGLANSCAVSRELYTPCSNEGETCAVQGTKTVRYGANGQWNTQSVTGRTPCDSATFGDPLPGVLKRCELL